MDVNELVQAVQSLNADDAFRPRLNFEQWRTLVPYLTRHEIRAGDVLIKQGDTDRTMYLLAQGSLQVFANTGRAVTASGSIRLAILRAGSVVGETGLFGDGNRMANVEAMTACTVYALRGPRLEDLSQRQPALAFELLRAAGAVMIMRLHGALEKHTPFI